MHAKPFSPGTAIQEREGLNTKPSTLLLIILLSVSPAFAQCCCMGCGMDLLQVHDRPITRDTAFLQALQDVLDSYRYTESYRAGKFDMDMTFVTSSPA